MHAASKEYGGWELKLDLEEIRKRAEIYTRIYYGDKLITIALADDALALLDAIDAHEEAKKFWNEWRHKMSAENAHLKDAADRLKSSVSDLLKENSELRGQVISLHLKCSSGGERK
jgi:hypothetical protein